MAARASQPFPSDPSDVQALQLTSSQNEVAHSRSAHLTDSRFARTRKGQAEVGDVVLAEACAVMEMAERAETTKVTAVVEGVVEKAAVESAVAGAAVGGVAPVAAVAVAAAAAAVVVMAVAEVVAGAVGATLATVEMVEQSGLHELPSMMRTLTVVLMITV